MNTKTIIIIAVIGIIIFIIIKKQKAAKLVVSPKTGNVKEVTPTSKQIFTKEFNNIW